MATPPLHLASYLAGSFFLTNAVPHVVAGIMGQSFQTPFAKPPGEGHSTSTVNTIWGWANVVIGYLLIFKEGDFDIRNNYHAIAVGTGGFLISFFSARHFGQFNGGNNPRGK
jgi:hypothetical protein